MICKSLSPPHHPSAKSGLLSVSSIIVVGLLAMGGALCADYYMDDFLFVLNDTGTAPAEFRLPLFGHSLGSAAADAKEISIFQLLPTFLTMLTGWLFPVNPVASHLWNLGIHLTLSVMIFGLGRRLLGQLGIMASKQGARQAALVAALVFACHPLGTEPVHYAKCHMVQLVAMFGFWASCEAVSFLVAPDKRTGLRLLSASFLCLISYFPGTVLLGLNLCFVALFMAKLRHRLLRGLPESVAGLRGHPWRMLAVLSGLILTGWVISFFLERFAGSLAGGKVIYPYHVVTQGRVFWEYVERLIVPVGLSSDHFQVWSSWRDPGAVCKFAGLVLLMVGSAWAALRPGAASRRGIGLLLVLFLIPFVMRMLYANMEIMVEYRAYNALPWFSLLTGCALAGVSSHLAGSPLKWLPAGALILTFTLLSFQRGQVWRSAESLAEDSLSQYPLNIRGRVQLQRMNLLDENYPEVLRLHQQSVAARDEINRRNIAQAGKQLIDPMRSNGTLIASYQMAVFAVEKIAGSLKALQFADASLATIRQRVPGSFDRVPGERIAAVGLLQKTRQELKKRVEDEGSATVTPGPG